MGGIMSLISFVSAYAWWQDATPKDAASCSNEMVAIMAVLVGIGCIVSDLVS